MAFQIEWTGPARDQFFDIVSQISVANPLAAEKLALQLARRIRQLGESPRSGAVYKRRRGYEVRQIVYRRYRVFYRVKPRLKQIQILSVWHGARQEPHL